MFCDLVDSRPAPGAAIALSEIEAWQRLHGVRLNAWELGTLRHLDAASRAKVLDLQRNTATRKPPTDKARR